MTGFQSYFAVAESSPGVLAAVEDALVGFDVNRSFSGSDLLANLSAGIRRDELKPVLDALLDVGALVSVQPGKYTVTAACLGDQKARTLVRESVRWLSSRAKTEAAEVLVASPAIGAEQSQGLPFWRHFADLRSAVRDIIAASKKRDSSCFAILGPGGR